MMVKKNGCEAQKYKGLCIRPKGRHLQLYFWDESVIEDLSEPVVISTGEIGGFDFGLKTFLSDREGNTYQHPQYLKAELKDMVRLNRGLSRKVKGSRNRHFQEQVCQKPGKSFQKIGRWQPTTKRCSRCGHDQALSLIMRVFECERCGLVLDRDWNATINICVEWASSTGLGDVRQKLISAVTAGLQEFPAL